METNTHHLQELLQLQEECGLNTLEDAANVVLLLSEDYSKEFQHFCQELLKGEIDVVKRYDF